MPGTVKTAIKRSRSTVETAIEHGRATVEDVIGHGRATVEEALHPCAFGVRHTTTPFPYLAPIINPARFKLGTTPTHCAFSKRSSGIPLSLASRISRSTAADSLVRFSGSIPDEAAEDNVAVVKSSIKLVKYFMFYSFEWKNSVLQLSRSGHQARSS